VQSSFWLVYLRYGVAVCGAGIPPTPPFIIDFILITVYPMNHISFALPYLSLNILVAGATVVQLHGQGPFAINLATPAMR
jgi:hypothetical protein